jgi:hypothetical protein
MWPTIGDANHRSGLHSLDAVRALGVASLQRIMGVGPRRRSPRSQRHHSGDSGLPQSSGVGCGGGIVTTPTLRRKRLLCQSGGRDRMPVGCWSCWVPSVGAFGGIVPTFSTPSSACVCACTSTYTSAGAGAGAGASARARTARRAHVPQCAEQAWPRRADRPTERTPVDVRP